MCVFLSFPLSLFIYRWVLTMNHCLPSHSLALPLCLFLAISLSSVALASSSFSYISLLLLFPSPSVSVFHFSTPHIDSPLSSSSLLYTFLSLSFVPSLCHYIIWYFHPWITIFICIFCLMYLCIFLLVLVRQRSFGCVARKCIWWRHWRVYKATTMPIETQRGNCQQWNWYGTG